MERKGTLIRVDKNGTQYYEGFEPCDRCNGEGIFFIGVCNGQPVPSHVDQGICFKCGGSKVQRAKWKIYTPEYEAKLEERRAKRRAKWEEEHREELERQAREQEEREAQRKAEEERLRAEQEAEEARKREQKLKSRYIGQVGEKIDSEAVYEFTAWFTVKSFYGYGEDTIYIHNFRIGDNKVVWKTSKGLGDTVEEGDRIRLKGTIKEHSEYKEEKQTSLIRCKIEPLK